MNKHYSIEDIYKIYLEYPHIQTDSRKIKKNDIYWALKGEKFNGNDFAIQALEKGASYAIVDEIKEANPKLVVVKDTLKTLQNLALYHRTRFNIPFIAITGSNGKTTTKELIYQVLKTQYRTSATEGNLNNHIGIPLTILKIAKETQMAIIEMGANHQKEIESYCQYVLPDYGIITNCGKAHIGLFGGEEGVRKGKGELYDFLKTKKNGAVFVNGNDDFLMQKSQGISQVLKYGVSNDCLIKGTILENNPLLKIQVEYQNTTFTVKSNLVGDYNLTNILCAILVGIHFNISISNIVEGIANYQVNNHRSQLIEYKTNQVILDAYNANPSSMELAILNFAKLDNQKKIVLLGEMKELGEHSPAEHQKIVDLLALYVWEKVILVGIDFIQTKNNYHCFSSVQEAKIYFDKLNLKNSHILIKGSRATKMESILEDV